MKGNIKNYQRCIATGQNLKAGHKLRMKDLLFMRFKNNLNFMPASQSDKILGKVIKTDYLEKQALVWKDLI